jgi:hypothetical protein
MPLAPFTPAKPATPAQPATPATRPGIRTTEFWGKTIFQIISLLSMFGGLLPGKYGIAAAVALEVAYGVSRGLAKLGGAPVIVPE